MTNFYNHIGGIFGQANKDFQEMTDNREADLFDTPPAETLETPPILGTHGENKQGMRGASFSETSETPVMINTSLEAKKSIQPHIPEMKRRLLDSLYLEGDATDQEMEARLGMAGNSLRPLRGQCVKDELIVPTGKTRPTKSGRRAKVWTLTKNYVPQETH